MTRLIPSLDLLGGRCVRLQQGCFDRVIHRDDNVFERLRAYVDAGAPEIHLVDLEAARSESSVQKDLLRALIKSVSAELQVGGGIRTIAQARALLDAGASRVVVGSLAIKQPEEAHRLICQLGDDRVTLAVDFRLVDGADRVATAAWTTLEDSDVFAVVQAYSRYSRLRVLCTDISRDGMRGGISVDVYGRLAEIVPADRLIASGGYRDREDLERCRTLGLHGVIVGSALFSEAASEEGSEDVG